MARAGRSSIRLGSQYRSRDAAHIVWEVSGQYTGVDGPSYVVMTNLFDPTWRKTMSEHELERGGQYVKVVAYAMPTGSGSGCITSSGRLRIMSTSSFCTLVWPGSSKRLSISSGSSLRW